MVRIDMNENIVARKFLTQNFANEINTNYGIWNNVQQIYIYILYVFIIWSKCMEKVISNTF